MSLRGVSGCSDLAHGPAINVGPPQKRLRVLFVVAHDSLGGAARATFRVFDAIRNWCPERIDIFMRTPNKTRNDNAILGGKPVRNRREFLEYLIRTRFRKYFPRRPFVSDNTLLHSQALYKTGLAREINALNPDVVLMGWLGNSTLAIEEIQRIKAPIVWRLSDMWMFSGAEHYSDTARYRWGYSRKSRPGDESGPDINRETFVRKRKAWESTPHVIALSKWLAAESQASTLSRDWPTHIIPVPIDTQFWHPVSQESARKKLGIESDKIVLLFGSGAGRARPFKGASLFFEAIERLQPLLNTAGLSEKITVAIFGEENHPMTHAGIPVLFLGRLDDVNIRQAYGASDVAVVPSTLEAFGQVAAEAQACGTPVVAFKNSGLADVVIDGVTGRLAPRMDAESLAASILWTIENPQRTAQLSAAAAAHAKKRWSPEVIAHAYARVLELASGRIAKIPTESGEAVTL